MGITKARWEALSGKAQWDVIVALRGPDCQNSETIKMYSTSVIRGVMGRIMRVGGTINDALNAVVVPTWAGMRGGDPIPSWRHDPNAWNFEHFFQHIEEAACVLEIPILFLPAKEYFEIFYDKGRSHWIKAGVLALETLNADDLSSPAGKALAKFLGPYKKEMF